MSDILQISIRIGEIYSTEKWMEEWILDELIGSREFCIGVNAGISLYQNVVVKAHEQKSPLKIGDSLYFIQDGRERLQQVLEEICK